MSNTTKTIPDKIKLLDQMLEDLAGDEFEEFDTSANVSSAEAKRYAATEDLDIFDIMH